MSTVPFRKKQSKALLALISEFYGFSPTVPRGASIGSSRPPANGGKSSTASIVTRT